nr:RNA-directed DNA polymerase, eukaryota [Tanacetum cinerariifolium]
MNTVRHENERPGSLFSRNEAGHFNAFIDSSGLIDLPIGGQYYTWMNKSGAKLSNLDRFLTFEGILKYIPDIKVMAIDRMWSDHIPILLHDMKSYFGSSPFKFYNSRLNKDGFDDLIKSMWSTLEAPNDGRILWSYEKLRANASTFDRSIGFDSPVRGMDQFANTLSNGQFVLRDIEIEEGKLPPPPAESDTSSNSELEVEAEDEDENEVATVVTITCAPYHVQPFSGTTYVGSGSYRKVFAPSPMGNNVDILHRKSVSALEDHMRGLMLEDKEEKERLKKKLKATIQKLVADKVAEAIDADRAQRNATGGQRNNANGAGGQDRAPPVHECTFSSFMKCNPTPLDSKEGAIELYRWFEKSEMVFRVMATLGLKVANGKSWGDIKMMMMEEFCPDEEVQRLEDELRNLKLRDTNIAEYTQRFNELVLLCSEVPPAGCPCERKGKQDQLDHRVCYILILDSRSDFIKPSNVIVRIVLFESKELLRSHHVDETMLELELLSKNWRDYDCFCTPFGGLTEHFGHSTIISHRIYE